MAKKLQPRQRELVNLLTQGLMRKEVAKVMGISPKTFDTHITAIKETMGFTTVAQLIHHFTVESLLAGHDHKLTGTCAKCGEKYEVAVTVNSNGDRVIEFEVDPLLHKNHALVESLTVNDATYDPYHVCN